MLYYKYYDRRSSKWGEPLISSDIIRGYNDTIILHLLLERDSYGYEISKTIEARSAGIYIIKETTLYSAFTRLERNGYIASYYGGETFGKRRNYYKITSEGERYYHEKCEEWRQTKKVVNQFTTILEEETGHE